ncbi:recombinase RecT [Morganella psychrotolerans]|uniref:Recombinase RecT n=1 Tax=Morganella psychrotolerans TaxID=368603 RepID=A0A5M9RB56_9GAMM|nr:RecT family recombinase [Morganella psychrotolerans]KAA8717452.1 recombinase RecT [Morganella psychrotolerans]OBU08276.1 recombinase RecT [Morganella psychrotolerans]
MSQEITTIDVDREADTSSAIFSPSGLQKLQAFAEVMSMGIATIPKHLAGNKADCLAIALQAAQWKMNPYAVAQKTHLVNGVLGYEAQLVNAVVTSSKAVTSRFHYRYGGDWTRITGTKNKSDETGLYVEVGAILRGDTEITWGEPLYMLDITTRNSPLWKTVPKQQIAYLAVKYWARLYCPEVILGVYTPDEFDSEPRAVRDITPRATKQDLNNLINNKPVEEKPSDDRSPDQILCDFTEAAGSAKSIDELEKFYKYSAKKLADNAELLDKATDIYQIRKDEIAPVE